MEGEQVHCGVCGEEVKSVPCNQENGETSPLLQNYLKGISCHFQEEIIFGDLEGLIACNGCSSKINSLQIRREWFEGLRKEVSEAEMNLRRKLTDMESIGLKLLDQTKELEKLIMDRIQKGDLKGQGELFLRKGTEKDYMALKGTLKELKEKQNYVRKWTGEVVAENRAETVSSSDQVACKILSVTSLAVIDKQKEGELKGKRSCVKGWTCGVDAANGDGTFLSSSEGMSGVITSVTSLATHNDHFEESGVFQVKTEQERSDGEENDNVSNGEPVPDCVVKVEDEEIRTIRHRVIYGNRKVKKIPFEALPNTMLQKPINQESAEYEVIDLENDETGASNELSELKEETVVGDFTERCEEGTMTTVKKRAIMEVDRDKGEVQVEQTRHKISRRSVSPSSPKKKAISEESPNGGGTESPSYGEGVTPLLPFPQDGYVALATQLASIPQIGEKANQKQNEPESVQSIAGAKERILGNTGENYDHCQNVEKDSVSKKRETVYISTVSRIKRKTKSTQRKRALELEEKLRNSIKAMFSKDMEKDESEKWYSSVMLVLNNSKAISVTGLRQWFLNVPKLSPDWFHELVVKLKEVGKLNVFNENLQHPFGTTVDPAFYRLIKNVEVEQHTLDILFEAGIDFNVLNMQKQNVLFAAIEGKRSIVFITNLIKRGINVNQIDGTGHCVLSFASGKGCSLEMLEFLIKEGAGIKDLEKGPYQKQLCKIFDLIPCMKPRLCLLKALVNKGDDLQGKWALEQFIIAGHGIKTSEGYHALLQYIYSSKNRLGWFDTEDEGGVTLLHRALSHYEIGKKAFEMLINANCNFKKVDKQGRGTLYYAIRGGRSVWVLETLIEQGADVNIRTASKANLLHSAANCFWKVPLETFKFLIDKGVDITAPDSDGYTALEAALKYVLVDLKLVKPLVPKEKVFTSLFIWSYDAGLRHLNKKNVSLVQYVAEHGSPLALNHILERASNFNINELGKGGLTLFERAVCSTNDNVVENAKALIKNGADVDLCKGQRETALHNLSVKIKIPEALRFCVEELRLDVNATDKNGMTPLLTILHEKLFHDKENGGNFKNTLKKVKILLENGANVNAKANPDFFVEDSLKLRTSLHLALYAYLRHSRACTFEFIKILVINGADVNEPTLEGWTAIHFIMATEKLDRHTLVRFTKLFGDKVDYSAKTHKGQTALHLAAKQRNFNSMKVCLENGSDVNDLDEEGRTCLDCILPDSPQNVNIPHWFAVVELLLENGATSQTKRKFRKEVESRKSGNRLNLCISDQFYNKLLDLLK